VRTGSKKKKKSISHTSVREKKKSGCGPRYARSYGTKTAEKRGCGQERKNGGRTETGGLFYFQQTAISDGFFFILAENKRFNRELLIWARPQRVAVGTN